MLAVFQSFKALASRQLATLIIVIGVQSEDVFSRV